MTFDFERLLGAVERRVEAVTADGAPARSVILERSYPTDVEDLWDAATNPERLPRWFAPVSGDFRPGGRYQVEGNAGGEITRCERPTFLSLTWVFAEQTSWVELRLAAEGADRSRLSLAHIAPLNAFWDQYGPGATGVGWEFGLLGLDFHLSDPAAIKPEENDIAQSADGRAFVAGASARWGAAAIAAGEDPENARAAAERTRAFYTGEAAPGA